MANQPSAASTTAEMPMRRAVADIRQFMIAPEPNPLRQNRELSVADTVVGRVTADPRPGKENREPSAKRRKIIIDNDDSSEEVPQPKQPPSRFQEDEAEEGNSSDLDFIDDEVDESDSDVVSMAKQAVRAMRNRRSFINDNNLVLCAMCVQMRATLRRLLGLD